MAKDKKSVLLYCDLIHTVEKMDDETAGLFFKHYLRYVNDLNPKTDNLIVDLTFESVKQNLKRDLKKWEQRAEKSRNNGALGGRPKKEPTGLLEKPKKPTGLLENQLGLKKPVTDTVTVTVTDNVNVNVNVKDKVIKSIEERKSEFKNSLLPFLKNYSKDLLKDFFEYWTEHGINDKKMRYEKQTSFSIERRLTTWTKNEKNFNKKTEPISKFDALNNLK